MIKLNSLILFCKDCEFKEVNFRDEQCRLSAKKTNNVKLADQMGLNINNANLEWKAYYSSGKNLKINICLN